MEIHSERERQLKEVIKKAEAGELKDDDLEVLKLLHARVQNIVLSLRLEIPGAPPNTNIDVKSITRYTKKEGSKYNDSRFRAFRRGFCDPSGGVHMFQGMGTIVTGTKNKLVAEYLINVFVESMRRCTTARGRGRGNSLRSSLSHIRVRERSKEGVNIVCNMRLPFYVDLDRLAASLDEFQLRRKTQRTHFKDMTIEYKPKNFIGAIVKIHPKSTILVFRPGSMVTTGVRSMQQTRSIVLYILPLLFMCREEECASTLGITMLPRRKKKKRRVVKNNKTKT